MKIPCPYSWKKRTFAHKLCENGQSSESQHACMIGRVAPDEGKAIGLKASRTRDYLKQLVDEGILEIEGEYKNRKYKIKK